MRTEMQDGIEYRIVDLAGRIPGGEGIEFLYAQKVWGGIEHRNPYVGIACLVDGVETPFGLNISYPAFERDFLYAFIHQPTRLAVLDRAVQPIIDLLFAEGMFEGELEGLDL